MAQIAIPGKNPGELVIPALGRTIKMVEWREDGFYDSVQAASAPTAGSSLEFFRDLSNKNLQFTNLRTARRIPAGSEFIMARVGVIIAQAYANVVPTDDDLIKLAYAASLTFKINDRLITEGPAVNYQSGIGMSGTTTRNATGVVTTGVPSAAAAPSLMVAQPVADDDDLVATLDFKDNAWLSGGSSMPVFVAKPVVTLRLAGFIKKPQGK